MGFLPSSDGPLIPGEKSIAHTPPKGDQTPDHVPSRRTGPAPITPVVPSARSAGALRIRPLSRRVSRRLSWTPRLTGVTESESKAFSLSG